MSPPPSLRIDPTSPMPLHEQVAAAVRRAIAEGEARPGERIPPARDLAAVLGVNTNTVLRALRTLRDEGVLDFRRGRGITVTGSAEGRSALQHKIRELIGLAQRHGYGTEELIRMIEQSR
jgi:DNA-binding transcriptional regulator YhcF (GntR family)